MATGHRRRGRTELVASAVEHHAVFESVAWLGRTAGATVHWLPVDVTGRISEVDLDTAVGTRTALVSVMWANNEVGTLQPAAAVAARAGEHGALAHSDAVQAVGHVPVDFATSGLDLLQLHRAQARRSVRVGALLARRSVDLTAVQHGGGQERDVRSGTLNVAAVAGFAAAVAVAIDGLDRYRTKVRALRETLVDGIAAAVPDAVVLGATDPAGRLPGVVSVRFPGCPADALLMLLDAAGIDCAAGSACSAESPHPAVLLAMGLDETAARSVLRFSLAETNDMADLQTLLHALPRPPRPGRGGVRVALGPRESAGRDVRRCRFRRRRRAGGRRRPRRHRCAPGAGQEPAVLPVRSARLLLKEDAHDARRAADMLGIPFYVWDLSDRFAADVVTDFVAEYAAGRTPNPCLRCNEKIKFAAVLDRARGPRLRRGLHRPLRAAGPYRQRRGAASRERRGQGPVLRARGADPGPAAARDVPARRRHQVGGAGKPSSVGWAWPTSRTATTSASSPTVTRRAS